MLWVPVETVLTECVPGVALIVRAVGIEAIDMVHNVKIPALIEPKIRIPEPYACV